MANIAKHFRGRDVVMSACRYCYKDQRITLARALNARLGRMLAVRVPRNSWLLHCKYYSPPSWIVALEAELRIAPQQWPILKKSAHSPKIKAVAIEVDRSGGLAVVLDLHVTSHGPK